MQSFKKIIFAYMSILNTNGHEVSYSQTIQKSKYYNGLQFSYTVKIWHKKKIPNPNKPGCKKVLNYCDEIKCKNQIELIDTFHSLKDEYGL